MEYLEKGTIKRMDGTIEEINVLKIRDKFTEEEIAEAKTKIGECYELIIEVLKEYIDTSEENYKFIAIWIIGTYFHEQFNTYPYLFFNAMRGSGKTRILKLISTLAAKGDGSVSNNLTEACLFRIPRGTTTCIDEFEQIGNKEKQTLRELLNAAYKKGMKVKRMKKVHGKDGEKQVVEEFEPYFPIVMANIWGMDEVLADRAITLILEKSDKCAVTKKVEDFEYNPKIKNIKFVLTKFSDACAMTYPQKNIYTAWNNYIVTRYTNITTYTSYTPVTNEEILEFEFFNKIDSLNINGRNFELLFPILLTAKFINNELFEEIAKISAEITTKKKEEEAQESVDVSVYRFIATLENKGLQFVFMKDLFNHFKLFLGEEYDWLSVSWFGKSLKRLNLVLDKKKVAAGKMVILNHAKAIEKLRIFEKEEVKHE